MSGCNFDQEPIRTALHAQARSFNPPTDLKQQIDARLACQKKKEVIPMKNRNMKKIAAVAAVACMLTGTVCVAAVKHSGYFTSSSSALTEIDSFAQMAKLENKTGIRTDAKEVLDNGFAFASANIVDTNAMDAQGEHVVDRFHEISIRYEKNGQTLNYYVQETPRQFTDFDLEHSQAIESNGITYYYNKSNYLFTPAGYEPTEEEKAKEAAGELFISEGSSEREENVYTGLSWNMNGQGYSLFGMDLDLSADELLAIASQMQ